MQPIGHLCDLLGISRHRPGVFAAMVDILYDEGGEGGEGDAEAERDARIHARAMRFLGRG